MPKTTNEFSGLDSALEDDKGSVASSDEESNEEVAIEDNDTCTPFELQQFFPQKYCIQDETAVTLKKNYILSLAKDVSFTRLAAGLSDGNVHLFNISSERGLHYSSPDCISPPPALDTKTCLISVTGVRFMDETSNLLLIGTTNNLVRLFDLRTQAEVGRFQNDTENEAESALMPKNSICFDCNSNGRILCVGSEQYHNNAFLTFYDLRERKQLGSYLESHQDDVTTLRFHPQNPDLLCSGSTDGLVNIYNIQKSTEDESLIVTFNTVSSVHKVNWHKNVYEKDVISCITHTNDLKMYDYVERDLIAEFERVQITEIIKRQAVANCHLIGCHNTEDGRPFVLTGSYLNKGEILRSLLVQNKQLLPGIDFQGNKQVVRESVFDFRTNALITAGESGIVTLWTNQLAKKSGDNILKAQRRKHKKTPY